MNKDEVIEYAIRTSEVIKEEKKTELINYFYNKKELIDKEIYQLKDNWNKLKEYINEANEDLYWTNNYDDILYVMQELEKGDSNE